VAKYSLLIKPSAAREIEAVDHKKDCQRIVVRILALADMPRPPGCEKLAGKANRYRVRVGSYRIVYSIDEEDKSITVVRVGHRKEVYR
jgi:mRNA interferase RelE/StbE